MLIHSFLFIFLFSVHHTQQTTRTHARMPARTHRCKRKQLFDVTKNYVQKKSTPTPSSVLNMFYSSQKEIKEEEKILIFFFSGREISLKFCNFSFQEM